MLKGYNLMPLTLKQAKALVVDVIKNLRERVEEAPEERIHQYNLLTLDRDILLYLYLLHTRLGPDIDVTLLRYLITGYYGDEPELMAAGAFRTRGPLIALLTNIDNYLITHFADLLESRYDTSNGLIKLADNAVQGIKEAFIEQYQFADTFAVANWSVFDFVAEINLLEPTLPDFASVVANEIRNIFGNALTIEPVNNGARKGNIGNSEFSGNIYHLSYADQWDCLFIIVANQGAFTQAFLNQWATIALSSILDLQMKTGAAINTLLIASDTSEAQVSSEAMDVPYFYHAWPMAAYKLLGGLRELVNEFGAEPVLAQFLTMFPEEKNAHFAAGRALERLRGNLTGR